MTLIRFTRGTGIGGAVVRFGTFSWCAHVGFKLEDGSVLDATPEFGVAIRKAQDDETTQYWRILSSTRHILAAVDYAKAQIGKPYDWTALCGTILRRDWHEDTKFFCSELVAAAFDRVHWPLVRDSGRLNRITPRDLLMSTRLKPINPQNA